MTAPAFIPDDSGLFPVSFPHLTDFENRALNIILRAWEDERIEDSDAEAVLEFAARTEQERAIELAATVSLRRIEQERGK